MTRIKGALLSPSLFGSRIILCINRRKKEREKGQWELGNDRLIVYRHLLCWPRGERRRNARILLVGLTPSFSEKALWTQLNQLVSVTFFLLSGLRSIIFAASRTGTIPESIMYHNISPTFSQKSKRTKNLSSAFPLSPAFSETAAFSKKRKMNYVDNLISP